MRGNPMTAIDAQFYWMSEKIPSDQFLVYAFAGVPDLGAAAAEVLGRARLSPELTMRVDDAGGLRYPRWVPSSDHLGVTAHRVPGDSWAGCLDVVVRLADGQVDASVAPWKLHLFAPVDGIPGHRGRGTVVVLQVAHALADGARASALAAWLFGRPAPVPAVQWPHRGCLPLRAVVAAREHRSRVADTGAGVLPAPVGDRPLLSTNNRPAGVRALRTLVRRRAELSGPTVTVAVLCAVSEALAQYLDEPCDELGAEVPMAKSGGRQANNHFGNIPVGLYPRYDRDTRIEAIAADVANGRLRADHSATVAADRAFAATPAVLLRWGVQNFDTQARPARVTGNTVVSSVYRGAADLSFGAAPVVLTTGFPALSPVMGLTHGVHGIGDTVAISVHAAASAITDIDVYLRLLDAAL
ncbi:wax ester/triacylglycerol synthase family O-acyltransferase [Mycolicibacter sp. MYC123]|uniref:Wax ester/triacylglycerol synthase family O-acyltransferase n=1 Tax=[Mycobacterium] zoologicum TaxID=2872311 RepID=A0ABU5YNS4_9MYCO|nr:wax ester/triacylglycerol synthase family O-acyltransferase [Mycolicibacter sp. MYC123]MEB3051540.1 wax ester/triacylglycerol synthase family O-acyltransferase [Mycolicibacter sp. MYC123]